MQDLLVCCVYSPQHDGIILNEEGKLQSLFSSQSHSINVIRRNSSAYRQQSLTHNSTTSSSTTFSSISSNNIVPSYSSDDRISSSVVDVIASVQPQQPVSVVPNCKLRRSTIDLTDFHQPSVGGFSHRRQTYHSTTTGQEALFPKQASDGDSSSSSSVLTSSSSSYEKNGLGCHDDDADYGDDNHKSRSTTTMWYDEAITNNQWEGGIEMIIEDVVLGYMSILLLFVNLERQLRNLLRNIHHWVVVEKEKAKNPSVETAAIATTTSTRTTRTNVIQWKESIGPNGTRTNDSDKDNVNDRAVVHRQEQNRPSLFPIMPNMLEESSSTDSEQEQDWTISLRRLISTPATSSTTSCATTISHISSASAAAFDAVVTTTTQDTPITTTNDTTTTTTNPTIVLTLTTKEECWGHFTDFQEELADESSFIPSCNSNRRQGLRCRRSNTTNTGLLVVLPPLEEVGEEKLEDDEDEDENDNNSNQNNNINDDDEDTDVWSF